MVKSKPRLKQFCLPKHWLAVSLFTLFSLLIHANSLFLCSPLKASTQKIVHLAFTSDVHGWLSSGLLYPKRRKFGLLHLQQTIQQLQQQYPGLILLDGGDVFTGSLLSEYSLKPFVKLLGELNYSAIVIGNHDLEHFDRLSKLDLPGLPLITANVKHNGQLAFRPYIEIKNSGLTLAVIGLTTPTASAAASNIEIQGMLKTIKLWNDSTQHADVKIGLVHAGINFKRGLQASKLNSKPLSNINPDLLAEFDIVFSGHDHRLYPYKNQQAVRYFAGVPVISGGYFGRNLQLVHLHLKRVQQQWKIEKVEVEVLKALNEPVAYETWLEKDYLEYMHQKTAWQRVGRSDFAACLNHALSQAVWQTGLFGTALPALRLKPFYLNQGQHIERRHLFYWLPYNNRMVKTQLSLHDVKKLLHPLKNWQNRVPYNRKLQVNMAFELPENSSWLQTHQKNLDFLFTDYHAGGGAGLHSSLLVPATTAQSFVAIRQQFFDWLNNNPPTGKACAGFVHQKKP